MSTPQQQHQRVVSHRKPRLPADIGPEEHARHEESVRQFPELQLSAGEYVMQTVRRHPIGLLSIWAVAGLLIVLAFAILPLYAANQQFFADLFMTTSDKLPSALDLSVPVLIAVAFVALGGFIATYVYVNNRFYLTNESIVQHVQYSLFNTKQQVVNLINVEDASSTQNGILEQILNYGTLRLSTQGEETVYHFRFVANPKKVVHDINDATEIAVRRLEGAFPPSEF